MILMAPSIRVAVGEELGLAPGAITTSQIATAQRMLGALRWCLPFPGFVGATCLPHTPPALPALLSAQLLQLQPPPAGRVGRRL